MAGHCRIYLTEFDAGIADMRRRTHSRARSAIGTARCFRWNRTGLLLAFGARYAEAEPVLREALAQAASLGARRYQVVLLTVLAETLFATGRAAEAHERNEEAFVLAHETGIAFRRAIHLRAQGADGGRSGRARALSRRGRGVSRRRRRRAQPDRLSPHRHRRHARPRRMGARARACGGARDVHARRAACRMSISWSRADASSRRWARSPRTRLRAPSSRGSRRKPLRLKWPIAWPGFAAYARAGANSFIVTKLSCGVAARHAAVTRAP